jgi:hypothetical protein
VRTFGLLVAVVGLMGSAGCTHHSLARNTVHATTTITDITYSQVLSNLALFSAHPESLPNHINLADGVVQVNDRAGFGQAGGFTTFGGADFGIDQFGPSGQRQLTEQWGTDATLDPERLYDLQSLYRAALGLSPLPPPNAVTYLRRPAEGDGKSGKTGRTSDPSGGDVTLTAATQSGTTSSGGGGSTPGGGGSSGDGDRGRVPLPILLTDVPPPGWYHIGCKKDVPKDACHVGRWGDRYAWVTADGVPHLARFTITALMVIKLKPGERAGQSSGLAVTGGN